MACVPGLTAHNSIVDQVRFVSDQVRFVPHLAVPALSWTCCTGSSPARWQRSSSTGPRTATDCWSLPPRDSSPSRCERRCSWTADTRRPRPEPDPPPAGPPPSRVTRSWNHLELHFNTLQVRNEGHRMSSPCSRDVLWGSSGFRSRTAGF